MVSMGVSMGTVPIDTFFVMVSIGTVPIDTQFPLDKLWGRDYTSIVLRA